MTNYTITSLRGAAIHLHNVPICYRKSIESSAIFIFTWWITSGFALVMTTSIPSLRGRQDEDSPPPLSPSAKGGGNRVKTPLVIARQSQSIRTKCLSTLANPY